MYFAFGAQTESASCAQLTTVSTLCADIVSARVSEEVVGTSLKATLIGRVIEIAAGTFVGFAFLLRCLTLCALRAAGYTVIRNCRLYELTIRTACGTRGCSYLLIIWI